MNADSIAPLVNLYRASVADVPATSLDSAILAAAARQSAVRRTARFVKGALAVVAIAVVLSGTAWQFRSSAREPHPARTDFGLNEVAQVRYLLDAGTQSDLGPEPIEGAP